jgi:ADP-L-glycero-D-manno-heptose 6-epimerase
MKQSNIQEDKSIVITGAAGFIGSCFVRYLNDLGFANLILVDDYYQTDKWKNLENKKYREMISKNDLFSYLNGQEENIQSFVHLGACSDTVCQDEDYLYKNNFLYSKNLCEYALKNNHRFVYASSAATYGIGDDGFCDSLDVIKKLKPINLYAHSKQNFDLWCLENKLFDQVTGLKYFNVFGPNEEHKKRMSSMVLKMTYQIKKTNEVKLFKSTVDEFSHGDQQRDFIYVKDAVNMTYNLLKRSYLDKGGLFNIGRGESVTWNELAKACFKALKKEENIKYVDMPKDLVSQYQNYTCADMNNYRTTFNINEKSSFTTSIDDAVDDYVNNFILMDEKW